MRRQRKKTRVQKHRILIKGAREDMIAQREADQQIAREERQDGERSGAESLEATLVRVKRRL